MREPRTMRRPFRPIILRVLACSKEAACERLRMAVTVGGWPMDSSSLLFPALGNLYATLTPWAEALLRAAVGLALVPHGLRNTFGFFPNTGVRAHDLGELSKQLDADGYRPGALWAP